MYLAWVDPQQGRLVELRLVPLQSRRFESSRTWAEDAQRLGDLLNRGMGKAPSETGSSILQRIANDPASSDYDPSQPDGRYYYAGDPAELNAAFQAVRDQIVRLTE